MSEYAELKESIEILNKKTDRILSWAEGDHKLGTPSIAQQIEECKVEIVQTRKRTYENEKDIREALHLITNNTENIESNTDSIRDTKQISSAFGAGAGGILVTIIEAIKHFFTSF